VLQAPKNLPDAVIQVPLGVHGVQNEPLSFTCSLVGAYLPFAKTKDAATDKRPSLAERYKDHGDYVNPIRVAARGGGGALPAAGGRGDHRQLGR